MTLTTEWLDTLFSKAPEAAWSEIFLKLETLIPSSCDDLKSHYQKAEGTIAHLDHLLHHGAWELWQNFREAPRGSSAVMKFWKETVGPKAVLILDSLSVREIAPVLGQAKRIGAVTVSVKFAASELPSETELYAMALGLPGRFSLKNRPLSERFPCFDIDTFADTFKKMPFMESEKKVGDSKNIFLWHGWPDDVLHDLAKSEDAFNQLINNVQDMLDSDGFLALLKKIARGREVLVTSDHGYCNASAFVAAQDAQHQELKQLGHTRAKPIAQQEKKAGSTIPPVTMDLQATSSNDIYRVAVGRLRPNDKGFPALTHGGLSLMECVVPLIRLRGSYA